MYEPELEGSMNIPSQPNMKNIGQPDFNTLDEPIKVTVVSTDTNDCILSETHFSYRELIAAIQN